MLESPETPLPDRLTGDELEGKLDAVRRGSTLSFPTAEIEQMLSEIERGRDA